MMNWFRNIKEMSRTAYIFLLISIIFLIFVAVIILIALTPIIGFPLALTAVFFAGLLLFITILLISG